MVARNAELTLELRPRARLDLINVTKWITECFGDFCSTYPKAFYCSYHTTAGYLEPDLCAKLGHRADSLQAFVKSFQALFPPNTDYRHDQLPLRMELSENQRCQEPLNADSHLTFIGAGLTNSVTYRTLPTPLCTSSTWMEFTGRRDDGDRQRSLVQTRTDGCQSQVHGSRIQASHRFGEPQGSPLWLAG